MKTDVISYIDGFNLYYALKRKGWQRYYWLNIADLSQRLLITGQVLVAVKYFTARVKNNPDKKKRQSIFLDALKTLPKLEIIEGSFQKRTRQCTQCDKYFQTYEEKMTDVNIAVALLEDAMNDRFDTALLISADGDLTKPIVTVKKIFPNKRIVVAFPPGYSSFSLRANADAYLTIGRKNLKDSLFAPTVMSTKGKLLRRPSSWS